MQWYGNVPAVENVIVFDEPAVISPVSHVPTSLVAVWVRLSLFVKVTLVPLVTVRLALINELPDIRTVFAGGLLDEVLELQEYPPTIKIIVKMATHILLNLCVLAFITCKLIE
jgi:hypothetical protein